MTQKGFTLIEAMMACVIIFILVGIAAPSMQTLIERNRTESQTNAIFNALMTARSESITRNQPTILCKSSDQSTCTTSGHWEQGWLIFIDENANGILDTAEDIISSNNPLSQDFTLRAESPIGNTIAFQANGTTRDTGAMMLCPPSKDVSQAYTLVISITGRVRLSKEVLSCP